MIENFPQEREKEKNDPPLRERGDVAESLPNDEQETVGIKGKGNVFRGKENQAQGKERSSPTWLGSPPHYIREEARDEARKQTEIIDLRGKENGMSCLEATINQESGGSGKMISTEEQGQAERKMAERARGGPHKPWGYYRPD